MCVQVVPGGQLRAVQGVGAAKTSCGIVPCCMHFGFFAPVRLALFTTATRCDRIAPFDFRLKNRHKLRKRGGGGMEGLTGDVVFLPSLLCCVAMAKGGYDIGAIVFGGGGGGVALLEAAIETNESRIPAMQDDNAGKKGGKGGGVTNCV